MSLLRTDMGEAYNHIRYLIGVQEYYIAQDEESPKLRQQETFPSEQLEKLLSSEVRGRSLGLQVPDPSNTVDLRYISQDFPVSAGALGASIYFQHLLYLCLDDRITPVYLDHDYFTRKRIDLTLQALALRKQAKAEKAQSTKQLPLPLEGMYPQERISEQSAKRLEAGAAWTDTVYREIYMLQRLADKSPAVVIVGLRHARFWMSRPELLAHYGLVVDHFLEDLVYRRETIFGSVYEPKLVLGRSDPQYYEQRIAQMQQWQRALRR